MISVKYRGEYWICQRIQPNRNAQKLLLMHYGFFIVKGVKISKWQKAK